jgi:hypothetical protein
MELPLVKVLALFGKKKGTSRAYGARFLQGDSHIPSWLAIDFSSGCFEQIRYKFLSLSSWLIRRRNAEHP